MPGSFFRSALMAKTGISWDEWVRRMEQTEDPTWSTERMAGHLREVYRLDDEWAGWLAVMYGERLGRIPVGVTKDAGVQMGVRRTWTVSREKLWEFLTTPPGLTLWLGSVSDFRPEKGFTFATAEGVTGKLTAVHPYHKLRMTWQRPEWSRPSRLQLTLLSANGGRTTLAVHQEMLEDVYVRELMRRHWEERLQEIRRLTEDAYEQI